MMNLDCPKGCGALVRQRRRGVWVYVCPQCHGWATEADFQSAVPAVIQALAQEVVKAGMKIPKSWEA